MYKPVTFVIIAVAAIVGLIVGLLLKRTDKKKQISHILTLSTTPGSFVGKVVFISGGTSGIGLATAIAFAAAGAQHVIVCGRQPEKWNLIAVPKIQQSLLLSNDQKQAIEYMQCDVRIYADVEKIMNSIIKKYGKLDVAFNNAGVAAGAPIQSQTLSSTINNNGLSFNLSGPQPCSFAKSGCTDPSLQTPTSPFCENALYTDGIGVWNCMKAELEVMVKQLPSKDPPVIVNTSSVNSIWGSPGASLYGAAKAMVTLLTKGVAVEQATFSKSLPIRINCIMPGAVYTPLLADQIKVGATYDETNKAANAGVPLGRIAYPEEIAPTVLFLADNTRSSYITGTSIVIDGGLTASPILVPQSM